jgi:hypothetical protein
MMQLCQILGFGKHIEDISEENFPKILLRSYFGATMACFASAFSKISFGITLLRLTNGLTRYIVWFCIITLFLIVIPSAVFIWVQCEPLPKAWDPSIPGVCWNGGTAIYYGIFNAGWSATMDFALALLPWTIIWGLSLQMREKIGIGIAMSMGVLAGVCAIVKGFYLVELQDEDFSCKCTHPSDLKHTTQMRIAAWSMNAIS